MKTALSYVICIELAYRSRLETSFPSISVTVGRGVSTNELFPDVLQNATAVGNLHNLMRDMNVCILSPFLSLHYFKKKKNGFN